MYIKRALEKQILNYIKAREIIAIVGPRQCGKTTLLQHIARKLKKASFITFEDVDIRDLFTSDIRGFIEAYVKGKDFLFIDEFQYAKEGGKQLKYIYDTEKIKIFITGSSVSELSIQSLKYLAGRIFIFNLFPLSFEEFLQYKSPNLAKLKTTDAAIRLIEPLYREFLLYGGYPRVVLAETPDEKVLVLKNIYKIYLLKEIREILQIHNEVAFAKIMKALSLQTGGLVNYAEISKLTNIPYHEIVKYVSLLGKTFVCIESRPFYKNPRTEISKSPKIYFLDNGFRNVCSGNFYLDEGRLAENFVAGELTKKEIKINFWRTKAKAEVDFVAEIKGKIIPIEVKAGKEEHLGKALISFIEKYSPKKAVIFSKNITRKKYKRTEIIFTHPASIPSFEAIL